MARFFGALLIGVGLLIAGAGGLCTVTGVLMLLRGGGANLGEALGLPALFGAAPILVGVGLFLLGRRLHRRAKTPGRDRRA